MALIVALLLVAGVAAASVKFFWAPADTQKEARDPALLRYLDEVTQVTELLNQVLDNIAGPDALDVVTTAEAQLQSLTPPAQADSVHQTITQAAQKTRAALERLLEGIGTQAAQSEAKALAGEARNLLDQARVQLEELYQ